MWEDGNSYELSSLGVSVRDFGRFCAGGVQVSCFVTPVRRPCRQRPPTVQTRPFPLMTNALESVSRRVRAHQDVLSPFGAQWHGLGARRRALPCIRSLDSIAIAIWQLGTAVVLHHRSHARSLLVLAQLENQQGRGLVDTEAGFIKRHKKYTGFHKHLVIQP